MSAAPFSSPFADHARPARVAHRGGNSRRALRAALAAEVDWLEVDVWWQRGLVVARHDPTIGRLPITYNRWRIGVTSPRPLTLDELLDSTAGTSLRLLLDLKGPMDPLPAAIVDVLTRRRAVERAALCGQEWGPLDEARAREPALGVVFSLGQPAHLPAYRARLEAGTAPPAISIRHTLLTPALLTDLGARGVDTLAWTVNDPARAAALVRWGVAGITSDSLTLLRGLT